MRNIKTKRNRSQHFEPTECIAEACPVQLSPDEGDCQCKHAETEMPYLYQWSINKCKFGAGVILFVQKNIKRQNYCNER